VLETGFEVLEGTFSILALASTFSAVRLWQGRKSLRRLEIAASGTIYSPRMFANIPVMSAGLWAFVVSQLFDYLYKAHAHSAMGDVFITITYFFVGIVGVAIVLAILIPVLGKPTMLIPPPLRQLF
jgi:hypothetical protein